MDNNAPTQFLHAFSGILNGLRLYPPQHPAILTLHKTLWDSLQNLLMQCQQKITFGVIDETLFIGNQLYTDGTPAAETLAKQLEQLQIEGIEITTGLQHEQLRDFIELFNQGKLRGQTFDETLNQKGISNIRHIQRDGGDSAGNMARKTYDHAKNIIQEVSRDVRNGQVPRTEQVVTSVDKMVRQIVKTPYAMLALNMIKDYDDYTYAHSVNVSVLALTIGRSCQLDAESLNILGMGSLLHDLGKLKIAPYIIKKPGRLTPPEYEEVKLHPELGAKIAQEMDDIDPRAIDIILSHHLHYDRCGYPSTALAKIHSELVDIATVADTYDAMTTLRAYHRPRTPRQAINIMQRLSGSQLHPHYLKHLEQTLGPFPVGSLVRLVSNEIGLIVDMDPLNRENSTIRIVKNKAGNNIDTPYDHQLSNSSHTIAGEVDPLTHNINISSLLSLVLYQH
ncbi:MAG: HD-GYP domain-containing protein [Thermodesulfobacteriota bacterium]|nr:HD-GYP domain-containing protein [Thermodesulfobacteriota bacterium]